MRGRAAYLSEKLHKYSAGLGKMMSPFLPAKGIRRQREAALRVTFKGHIYRKPSKKLFISHGEDTGHPGACLSHLLRCALSPETQAL